MAERDIIDRLNNDQQFIIDLLTAPDVKQVIAARGFTADAKFLDYVEQSIKKVRTYITDQIHVLEVKSLTSGGPSTMGVLPASVRSSSGNGFGNW
jgi:hypothetical protein